MDAHKVARGAVRGASAEGGPSISGQDEAMLLMVESPERFFRSKTTVLRSINEMQPSGTVNYVIPYRPECAYTLFQGERAKSGFLSSRLFQNKLALARYPWGPIIMTKLIGFLPSIPQQNAGECGP